MEQEESKANSPRDWSLRTEKRWTFRMLFVSALIYLLYYLMSPYQVCLRATHVEIWQVPTMLNVSFCSANEGLRRMGQRN